MYVLKNMNIIRNINSELINVKKYTKLMRDLNNKACINNMYLLSISYI